MKFIKCKVLSLQYEYDSKDDLGESYNGNKNNRAIDQTDKSGLLFQIETRRIE